MLSNVIFLKLLLVILLNWIKFSFQVTIYNSNDFPNLMVSDLPTTRPGPDNFSSMSSP